jgi:GTPase SAR1 family protein
MSEDDSSSLRIAVVGACASGKSTLVDALRRAGYEARHVAQEHSYVPSMWQRITRPDVLIYLDVDYDTILTRRPNFNFQPADLDQQNFRLAHARENCDLYLDTTGLTTAEVRDKSLDFLRGVIGNW